MDIGMTVELASIVAVAITAIFTFYQWMGSMKITKSTILHELLEIIRSNSDIREAWYYLEYYEGQWYDDSFHDSPLEKKMDHLLAHMNYITYLRKTHVISKREFRLFDYQIRSVSRNPGIQCYFYNLYHFSRRNNSLFSFECFFEYCLKRGYFCKDILNPNCKNYYVVFFNKGFCECGAQFVDCKHSELEFDK